MGTLAFYLLNLFTPQKAFVNGPVFLSKIEVDLWGNDCGT